MILPRSTMTFVSNDPAFRAAYASTVFVGDRYTGNLAPSATLTLTRPDASVADTVTYGGAGWPVPTAGQSLELTDLAADNDDGTNWALSTGSGTPGSTSGGGPVVTAPGAPTIGTASAGNASATVRWTAPGDNGGSAITGYSVRVLNTAEHQVGALRPAGAAATSLIVTGLTNGTSYHFQVAATNSVGTGAFSASSNTVTPAGATVPGAPVIGTPTAGAAGGSLTAIARWTPPTSTGGSAITGYVVTALRMSSAPPTRPCCREPTHRSSVRACVSASSPWPPATTGSRSSPSTRSAPARHQPAPPTSSPPDRRAQPRRSRARLPRGRLRPAAAGGPGRADTTGRRLVVPDLRGTGASHRAARGRPRPVGRRRVVVRRSRHKRLARLRARDLGTPPHARGGVLGGTWPP